MSTQLKVYENYELDQLKDEAWSKLDYEFFKNFESEHTRKSYRTDITQFFTFIGENFFNLTHLNQIERVHFVAFKNWLSDLDLAPKTINRKLSANSSYFDFLAEKNIIRFNPVNSIKRPKQEVVNPTQDISDENVMEMFDFINDPKNKISLLHKAILYVLFTTGIRKSELINLKRENYFELNGHKVIKVKAKGAKYLTKVLPGPTVEILNEYLNWMEDQGRAVHEKDWVFQPSKNPRDPNNLTRPLNDTSIDYIIKSISKKCGIPIQISPHSARATYIGSALEAGVDLFKVSQDVGHASVKTTQEYNKRRQKLKESPAYKLGFLKKS